MSDNWVVQNLENALNTWNEKLAEIWQLITQSPENFKGGAIWGVIQNIHGALQAVGLALLVLFFVVGVMRTCGSLAETKRPETALKLFIRFALAKGVVTYGLELMMALFRIVQGVISTIMNSAGFGSAQQTVLPSEIVNAVEDCGFFESIPLWAVTLIGGLFITVLSFVMIMTVYGRFFKLYLYAAIAPIPLSTFAGEPTQNVGRSFLKSYAAVCLEGAIIVLACIIFSYFAATPPTVNTGAAAVTMVWSYIGELVFNMLVLVGAALGELDHARLVVLELHDHHRRLVADLRICAFAELRERHRASGLVADVDEHVVALERRDGPLDHRTGLELRLVHRGREHLRHRGALRLGRRGFPDCHNTFLYFWVCPCSRFSAASAPSLGAEARSIPKTAAVAQGGQPTMLHQRNALEASQRPATSGTAVVSTITAK